MNESYNEVQDNLLFPSIHNLSNGMPNHFARRLDFLLGKSCRGTNFESGNWLPGVFAGRRSQIKGHGLESGDENAIIETLSSG